MIERLDRALLPFIGSFVMRKGSMNNGFGRIAAVRKGKLQFLISLGSTTSIEAMQLEREIVSFYAAN